MPKTIPIDSLKPVEELDRVLLSEEGVRLLEIGDPLNEQMIAALRALGYTQLIAAVSDLEAGTVERQARFAKRHLDELAEGELLAESIQDSQQRLLVPAGQPVPAAQKPVLKRLGITSVLVRIALAPDVEKRIGNTLLRLNEFRRIEKPSVRMTIVEVPKVELPPERMIEDSKSITVENVDRQIETAAPETLEEKPSGPPLSAKIVLTDPRKIRSVGRVRDFMKIHDSVVKNAEQIFALVGHKERVAPGLVSTLSNSVVSALINDRHLTLNLSGLENSQHYQVSHAINTVLLSVNIAAVLGFSQEQIYELSYGALLHDIGMMRLPVEVTSKRTPLNDDEKVMLRKHPVIGLEVLQSFSRIPKSAPLVVYQENERLDGSGYPKGRKKGLIHTYAKIVMVASAYDSMISDRPYRKARLPYYAMEVLLQQVNQQKFESRVVRALLKVMGLFPIGSWVRLNDGSTGRIVGANERAYTRPVVSLLLRADGTQLDAPEPVDMAEQQYESLEVIEALSVPGGIEGDMRTIGF